MCGATEMDKAIDPTWLMTMSNVSTIGVKTIKVGAGDDPTSSRRMSCPPSQHSQTRSWSLQHHSQVPDPVHLPLAPVPGQGVHQVPVVQDLCNQAPVPALTLDLTLDSKCLQKAVILVSQDALAPHHLM